MSSIFPKNFKLIILQKGTLPKHDLNDAIIHCSNIDEFQMALNKYGSFILTIACNEDFLPDIPLLLRNLSVDKLYVLTNQKEVMWPIELDPNDIELKEIQNEKQLMRSLCLDAMHLYYQQSIQHRTMGNNSLNDMCITESLRALKSVENFV